MVNNASTSARAQRGALLLDDELPGWALHVRAARINMASPVLCVLGQLMLNDPRVRERMLPMMHPQLAAASTDTYHGAAFVVFGKWPLAQTLYDYGFDGSVWANVNSYRINLLDGAWASQVERRGGARSGRPPRNLTAKVDASRAP